MRRTRPEMASETGFAFALQQLGKATDVDTSSKRLSFACEALHIKSAGRDQGYAEPCFYRTLAEPVLMPGFSTP